MRFPFSYWSQHVWNVLNDYSLVGEGYCTPLYRTLQISNKMYIITLYEIRAFKNRFILMPAFQACFTTSKHIALICTFHSECFWKFFSTILGLSNFLLYYAGGEDTKLKYVFSWCDKYTLSRTAHNFLSNVLKRSTKASSQLFKHIQIGNISICLFLKFAPLACIKEKSPNRGNAELF